MAVVFSHAGITTFTCSRDPAMGNFSTTRQWKSPSIRSGGGTPFVYDKDVVKDLVTLTWKYMDPTDLLNCLAFLRAINFSADSFTFVDPAGNSHAAQYWGPQKLVWTPVELSERDFTVELLVWDLPA